MYTFEPAQLDNICPHPIESVELLKWSSLDRLKQDFYWFRNETDQLDTRIKIGLYFSKQHAEEKRRELSDIFVVPAESVRTAKDIIDIRLCAYIRALELILTEARNMSRNHNIWAKLLISLYQSPSILNSFEHAPRDTPDIRWFFKNRLMLILLRKYSINHVYMENKLPHSYESPQSLLENGSLYIDEEDCFVIVKDILFPQLEPIKRKLNECIDCDDVNLKIYRFDESSCSYFAIIQSLVNRHESILQKSIQFSMEQPNQARRLLCVLFRVAHDCKKWQLINAPLASLLSNPTIEMRAFAVRLFARLVSLNKCRDATNFEMLSEHFDTLIKLSQCPSDEIWDADRAIWRRLGELNRLKPREYQLLRDVVNLYPTRIDRITQKGKSIRQGCKRIEEEYKTFCWLLMPRLNDNTGKFEFTSASNQLFEDLKMTMTRKEELSDLCYYDLNSVCREYKELLTDQESRNQFYLIGCKAGWLIVEKFDANSSRCSKGGVCWIASAFSYSNNWITGPLCFSPASHPIYCGILLEIHQCFYNRERILEPHRCFCFLQYIISLGPEIEEKLKAIESCLLRSIELYPRRKSKFFVDVFMEQRMWAPLRTAFRLVYHENETGRMISSSSRLSFPSSDDIQGIQSRRMLVVSLCKHLIAGLNYPAIPRIIDLIGELDLAYNQLRSEQEQDLDLSLLPSCVELAFPTPFDEPNNTMYICEFAYFRDTMDYLRRNKPEQLEDICSQLSEDENKRLEHYQNDYDEFDLCCCFTRRLDKERDRFRCIDHKTSPQARSHICPLLNRSQYQD